MWYSEMKKGMPLIIATIDMDTVSTNVFLGVFTSEEAARQAHRELHMRDTDADPADEPWGDLVLVEVGLDEIANLDIEHDMINGR